MTRVDRAPPAPRQPMVSDRGSGSVLSIAVVGVILAIAAILVPLSLVLTARQAAAGAADAAALAAADAAVGIVPGSPCAVADPVAAANGAEVTACRMDGVVVTVRVSVNAAGMDVSSTATAGPPGPGTN